MLQLEAETQRAPPVDQIEREKQAAAGSKSPKLTRCREWNQAYAQLEMERGFCSLGGAEKYSTFSNWVTHCREWNQADAQLEMERGFCSLGGAEKHSTFSNWVTSCREWNLAYAQLEMERGFCFLGVAEKYSQELVQAVTQWAACVKCPGDALQGVEPGVCTAGDGARLLLPRRRREVQPRAGAAEGAGEPRRRSARGAARRRDALAPGRVCRQPARRQRLGAVQRAGPRAAAGAAAAVRTAEARLPPACLYAMLVRLSG